MIFASILPAILGAYLIIKGIIESNQLDGKIIENQVYIVLYAVGAILLLIGIFMTPICSAFKAKIFFRILSILICCVLLFIFVTAALVVTAPLFMKKADGTEPVLLVLGAPVIENQPSYIMQSRAKLAAEWVKSHPDLTVMISGGKGGDKTEAETIADLMAQEQLDTSNYILETRATTTMENFQYAKELLGDSYNVATEPICVLTNRFHVYRLGNFLIKQGYGNVSFVTAATPANVRLLWYAREVVLTIRYWITGIA